jgi:chemotaxis protein MotB
MAKKEKAPDAGAPMWIVTFADLMSLLVCFFVLIISFSIQDQEKLQIVAGSMKDAFGVKRESKKAGYIERKGAPVRDYVKSVSVVSRTNDSDFAQKRHNQRTKQGPEANTHDIKRTEVERPRQFALAAQSLRQAWAEMPEITELSDNIMVEMTPEGLNIQLVDQDGRAMFKPGSKVPFERTKRLLRKMAPILQRLPNRIQITGHTDSTRMYNANGYSQWDLSADRAASVRRILGENGVPHERFYAVMGKADTEPLFPNDPFLAANRRVSILLMNEKPPLPVDYKP